MREVSVEDFKLFKEKVDNFITKDAETFYFRNLMEAIHDSDYMNEVNSIIEYVSKERTAKEIDELFQMLRAKTEGQFKLRDKAEEYEKKVNYSLRGLAYFCLVEALNENSSFSEKIIEDIKKKYGENQLVISDVNKDLDTLSDIVKEKLSDIIAETGRTREDIIIKNISAASRADILKRIVDCGIDVEHFETYKPSLNDIFVSLVGDEADNDNKKNNIEGGAH